MDRHLAQLNIARLKHDPDDPRVAEFMDNLDRVNAVAETMPGFVWRLADESGNATGIRAFDDPRLIVNLSVWEDARSLERFVWQTVHTRFYSRKSAWFDPMPGPHLVMWWVPAGDRPDIGEAARRLELLRRDGPGPEVFGWEGLQDATLWQRRRCA